MKNQYLFIAVACVCFEWPVTTIAQSGSLDLTFGTNGFVTTPIGFTDESGNSVAIQSDGKIVVAGYSENGTHSDFALVRYNTDGSLDNTFDSDGKVTTQVGINSANIGSVVIQSDDKIVVAGYSFNAAWYTDFTLARYNTNGSLDTSFNGDGIVITEVGSHNDEAKSIAIQSDGKIVVAGQSYNGTDSYFAVVRYNTDGSLDTSFDTDGIDTTGFGNDMNWGYAVAIQNDGKIVVVGLTGEILTFHIALIRYNTDGSLDTSFDTDGKVITATGIGIDYDAANDVVIQPDGKIVIAGWSEINADDDFAVVRYNTDGSLDTTFDTDGIVVTPFGTFADTPNSVVIQSDGKIIAAGYSLVGGTNYNFAMVRYNSNGSLDTTFDTDGKVTTLFGPDSDTGYDIALQSDGKIVMVGNDVNNNGGFWQFDFAVVRYNNTVNTGIATIDDQPSEIIIYPNPLITVATLQSNSILKDATLTLYNIYGQLVKQFENISGETFTFYGDNLPAGLYFVQLAQDNENIYTNKLIIGKP